MKKPVICVCASLLALGLVACAASKSDEGNEQSVNSQEDNLSQQVLDTEDAQVTEQVGEIVELDDIRETLVEVLGEHYWPNTRISPEYLADYGLSEELYEDFYGEVPVVSTNVDTLIIVQAKEGCLEEVEEVINRYREALVDDTKQYPMNEGKVKASRIETIGNYVCFVQLGADTTNAYGEDGNKEAVILHCQEQNELVIEALGKILGR